MHCLICGNELQGCLCPRCGFDLSLRGADYPTLVPEERKEPPLWILRSAYWDALNDIIQALTKQVQELERRRASAPEPENGSRQTEPTSFAKKWECECGCRNSMGVRYCTNCGRIIPEARRDPTTESQGFGSFRSSAARTAPASPAAKWECSCGCRNPVGIRYCRNCGQTRTG